MAGYPYWSVLCFSLPLVLVALLRKSLRPKLKEQYCLADEFVCSLLWLLWSFEISLVSLHTHSSVHYILLFIALLSQRSIYQEATVNTSALIVKSVSFGWSLSRTLLLLLAQLMALPVAMAMILFLHKVLAPFSSPHSEGVSVSGDVLQVEIIQGFIIEAIGTLLLSVPPALVKSRGLIFDFVSASNYTLIEYFFGPFTGAFCNPLSATCFCLFFNKQSLFELLTVYWAGSVTGALIGWRLFYNRMEKLKIP
uniref:Aquaporin n=1 Tax=Amphimedon queenslandica TaxID=400682 RepID=A0A1X7VNT9_AMPQE